MAKYNNEYQLEIFNAYQATLANTVVRDEYSIEVDGIFNEPPIMKTCQLLDMLGRKNGTDEFMQYRDIITRYCILGKLITLYLGDKKIGAFTLNNLDDPWELIPFMAEHPKGYTALCDIAMTFLLKKYILPVTPIANTQEGETVEK